MKVVREMVDGDSLVKRATLVATGVPLLHNVYEKQLFSPLINTIY
jgi:hypothetical protein